MFQMRNASTPAPPLRYASLPPRMSAITSLLRKHLKGRNLAHVARETGVNHIAIWRIAVGKQFADLRTGDAEKVFEFVTGKPLVAEEVGE